MITTATFTALLRVLVVGLIFGAGLPALFAVGVRLLAVGHGAPGDTAPAGVATRSHPAALGVAYTLFAAIAVVVFLGVLWITKDSLRHYLGIEVF